MRPRLLVITERLPRPDESSGSARLLAIVTALARHATVDLWVELDESEGPRRLSTARVAADRERLVREGVFVLPTGWPGLREALNRTYDTVVIEFYHVASRYLRVLRDHHPHAAIVVDSVDVHFARLTSGVGVGAVHANWARDVHRDETAVYRAADAVLVASSGDGEALAREPGMPGAICVPSIVQLRPRPATHRAHEAIFVGHFHHAPNLDGVRWFVEAAWPSVRARVPDATLSIIGSYASADVYALGAADGVTVHGYVEDLWPHLDRAAASIAPLRFGAGMKGKVAEALSAAIPVVTTSIGAQGLDLVHQQHAWVADDAASFADALVEVFRDPARAAVVGEQGQRQVAAVCGPDAIEAAITALLRVRRSDARVRRRGALLRQAHRLRVACWLWNFTRGRRIAGRSIARQEPGLTGEVAPPA